MQFDPVRTDIIKYEMRYPGGVNPYQQEQKKPGGFGRFLSGVGRFFGAVAAPLSFVFPPAAIGAATMYGVGQIGDQVQMKAYEKMMQNQQSPAPMYVPGLQPGPEGMINASGSPTSQNEESVMNVLYARNDMMVASTKEFLG